MVRLHTVIALAFLTCSGSLAFANSSQMVGDVGKGSSVIQEKLEKIESKIDSLESRINHYLPKPSAESEVGKNPYGDSTTRTMAGWSSKDHLTKAHVYEEQVGTLEKKIHELDDRIDRFREKPYLDTKGFRRANLRLLRGHLIHDLREATQKVVWHEKQAKKIMLSDGKKSGDKPSL